MRLLTPTEAAGDKQQAINLKRSAELEKEIQRRQQALASLEMEETLLLERQRVAFETEKANFLREVDALRQEVISLEIKRKKALEPLEKQEKDLLQREQKLANLTEFIEKSLFKLNEGIESLEVRLTDVSDREQQLGIREGRLRISEEGLEAQREIVRHDSKQVNELLAKIYSDTEREQQLLNGKKAKLLLREKAIQALEAEVKAREATFAQRERELADRYATLERTIKRYGSKT